MLRTKRPRKDAKLYNFMPKAIPNYYKNPSPLPQGESKKYCFFPLREGNKEHWEAIDGAIKCVTDCKKFCLSKQQNLFFCFNLCIIEQGKELCCKI